MKKPRLTKAMILALALSAAPKIVQGQVPQTLRTNTTLANATAVKMIASPEIINSALLQTVHNIVDQVQLNEFKCIPPKKGLLESNNSWLNRTNKYCERRRNLAAKAAIDYAKSTGESIALVQTSVAQTYLQAELEMTQKQLNAAATAKAKAENALEQYKRNAEMRRAEDEAKLKKILEEKNAELQRLKNKHKLGAIMRGTVKNVATVLSSVPKAASETTQIVTSTLAGIKHASVIIVAISLVFATFLAYGFIDFTTAGMLSRGIRRFAKTLHEIKRNTSVRQIVNQQIRALPNTNISKSPIPSPVKNRSPSPVKKTVLGSGNLRRVRMLSNENRRRERALRFQALSPSPTRR